MLTFSVLGWIGITMILIYLVMGLTDPLTSSQQKQMFRYIDRTLLRRHFDNPRGESSYDKENRDWKMLYNAFSDGWDPGHPATVVPARDPITHERLNNGEFDVVCGNRRLSVATEHMIDRVPCIVIDHLTYAEEMAMLMDHASVKGLSKKESVEAYRKLVAAGLNRDKIARVLGLLTRNGKLAVAKVDELDAICVLPASYQDEWLDEKKPVSEKSIKPTGENLKKLTQAIAKDRANSHMGARENGPAFKDAVKAIQSVGPVDTDYGSKKALRGIANTEKLSRVVEKLFLVLAGELKTPLKDMLETIRWMEQETLGTISGIARPAMVDKILGLDEPESTDDEPTVESTVETDSVETDSVETDSVETDSVETDSLELVTAESAPTPRRKRKS